MSIEIGIQLYSVRNYMHDVSELRSTLANLRACGYTCVETAGFAGLDVRTFAELLKEADLKAVSMHFGLDHLVKEFDTLCDEIDVLGVENCCVPGIPGNFYHQTQAGYTAVAEVLDAGAEKLAEKGIALSYHNHCHEFYPVALSCGQRFLFDTAKTLHMQLDVGHCYAARENPVEWLNRYNNRIETVHYKDVQFIDGKRHDFAIGEGEVDWVGVTESIKRSPCRYIIVEHEEFNRDVWDICKTSCENIRSLLA